MEKRQVPNHAYTQTVVHVPFIDFLYQQFCKGYTSVYFEDRQKLATAVCLLLRAFWTFGDIMFSVISGDLK